MAQPMSFDAQVVVNTTNIAADVEVLTGRLGFRIDAIYPADAPSTAIVSGHGVRLRLQLSEESQPATVLLLGDQPLERCELPGGSTIEYGERSTGYALPDNVPSLTITQRTDESGVGRAGMRYRDLVPDRWGGRFIASHIAIPEAGPVPDYVHFHKIRFQMIFVKSGWVRVVYEDQGEPFVMHAGDCVLQPPEIRHRVLESGGGLEVIEIGCPADHETIADWSLELPTGVAQPDRDFSGQRFVRHSAEGASYQPWRIDGWEFRDTGIGEATSGLAGARVARPTEGDRRLDVGDSSAISHATEYAQLVVLNGSVTIEIATDRTVTLHDGDSVALPEGTQYRLTRPSRDCELLDVTLPAEFHVQGN